MIFKSKEVVNQIFREQDKLMLVFGILSRFLLMRSTLRRARFFQPSSPLTATAPPPCSGTVVLLFPAGFDFNFGSQRPFLRVAREGREAAGDHEKTRGTFIFFSPLKNRRLNRIQPVSHSDRWSNSARMALRTFKGLNYAVFKDFLRHDAIGGL